jgi:hypothetical protein
MEELTGTRLAPGAGGRAASPRLTRGRAAQASVHGWTPLHLAARNGHTECVRALLGAKADVEAADEWKVLRPERTNARTKQCFRCFCISQ